MIYTFIDREIENGIKEGIKIQTEKIVDNIKKESKNEGIKEGIKEGEFRTVYKIIKNGLLSIEQAAKSIGLTKEQLLAGFKEYNLVL